MKTITRKMAVLYLDEPTILNDYKPKPIEVNWSACGAVSLDAAEAFAKELLELVEIGRAIQRGEAVEEAK